MFTPPPPRELPHQARQYIHYIQHICLSDKVVVLTVDIVGKYTKEQCGSDKRKPWNNASIYEPLNNFEISVDLESHWISRQKSGADLGSMRICRPNYPWGSMIPKDPGSRSSGSDSKINFWDPSTCLVRIGYKIYISQPVAWKYQ